MKISKVFILLAVANLAISISGCSPKDPDASLSSPVREKINEEIANMACVQTMTFPFSARGISRGGCFECEKFVEAGLLTKVEEEDPFASDSQEAFGRGGGREPDIRFELSELGMETYIPGGEDETYGKVPPRFCFGTAHVSKITRLVGPVMFNNAKVIGIRYIAELENPHPFIFDPRAKLLKIPLPNASQEGMPVLYPEENVSAIFNPNDPKDFYLDASFQVGM